MNERSTSDYVIGEKIFRDCTLKGFLGEGSFGRVYLVENRIGIPFALKVLHKNVNMEKRGLESVMKIRSNRLVAIQDFGKTTKNSVGVLMEYVPTNLEAILKKGRLDERMARYYFEEILKGIIVLVKHGIIHRDIKPANLFMLEDIIKIGDFGTAKFISGETSSMSEVAGTFHYMAPERFRREYGFSVDRWSAAVIFYRMLTGRYVFDGKDRTRIFGAIMMDEPNLDIVPPRYRDFFSRCFQKSMKKRHQTLKEMITDLNKIPVTGETKSVSAAEKSKPAISHSSEDDRTIIHLRKTPHKVPDADFRTFFRIDKKRKPLNYINNDFADNGDGTVTDHATNLTWQKSGSLTYISYEDIKDYLMETNRQEFAGYRDWRVPTVDELMSLLEPEKRENDLYIDPVFDKTQSWCWSSDFRSTSTVWLVYFRFGHVSWNVIKYIGFLRLVRS